MSANTESLAETVSRKKPPPNVNQDKDSKCFSDSFTYRLSSAVPMPLFFYPLFYISGNLINCMQKSPGNEMPAGPMPKPAYTKHNKYINVFSY